MRELKVDVAVIGAGTAGLAARRAAVKHGATTVMIEDGPHGTTCARVGCMPSKLLIAAAEAAHDIDRCELFGLRAASYEVDGAAVLARVRRERDRFVGFVVESVDAIAGEEKLHGRARFVEANVLEVDDHTRVRAKATVIATGSRPVIPEALRTLGDRILVNDDVFELADLPASIAVVGTGIIGLELGQAMARLGVETSFFSHSERLGQVSDPLVRDRVEQVFGRELDLHLGVEVNAAPVEGGCEVRWRRSNGTEESAVFERLLVAAGRQPNLDDMGLERCALQLDSRGIPLFDRNTMQCGSAPIFIAGDVDGELALLHEANDEGHIAGANAALYPGVQSHDRRVALSVTFTDPQIAVAGLSYAHLPADEVAVGEIDYADQGRARVMGKNAGLVRIYAKRQCGTLCGAEMFGPRVENTAHLLAWAIQSKLSVARALEMPFYHPVLEEGIRTALRDLSANLAAVAYPRETDCAPGS